MSPQVLILALIRSSLLKDLKKHDLVIAVSEHDLVIAVSEASLCSVHEQLKNNYGDLHVCSSDARPLPFPRNGPSNYCSASMHREMRRENDRLHLVDIDTVKCLTLPDISATGFLEPIQLEESQKQRKDRRKFLRRYRCQLLFDVGVCGRVRPPSRSSPSPSPSPASRPSHSAFPDEVLRRHSVAMPTHCCRS